METDYPESTYYFKVEEVFNDLQGNEFSCSEVFRNQDLRQASKDARAYYKERYDGIVSKHDDAGVHSICLYIVECVGPEEIEYCIAGDEELEIKEGLELERAVLNP